MVILGETVRTTPDSLTFADSKHDLQVKLVAVAILAARLCIYNCLVVVNISGLLLAPRRSSVN